MLNWICLNRTAYIYIYIYIYKYGNSMMISIPPFKIIYNYPAHEAYVMKIRNSDLGRRSPGGGRVLCKGNTYPSRHIRSKWSRNLPWLVNSASLICGMNRWPGGRVLASANCGCWFDLQWWRSRCALLMRANKVKTAVQCSVCRM